MTVSHSLKSASWDSTGGKEEVTDSPTFVINTDNFLSLETIKPMNEKFSQIVLILIEEGLYFIVQSKALRTRVLEYYLRAVLGGTELSLLLAGTRS